ncbi:DUF2846 domain-containing protein [Zestomonas thermotolerans]|uniref:DUF2846 domain-containing protein n=1 Tax=Zestomonas thermotolerans TaxID=157784 RepID=UPI000372E832|nr:DUF2846 domain-containing protein [Pseudomonas thermotolerans]
MRRHLPFAVLLLTFLAGCSTPGGFFGSLDGPVFQAHARSDAGHALVYVYRPQSRWADQELEAPGLFLDGRLVGALPSNGYLALELDGASYHVEMRRPLLGSYWTLFADGLFDFTRITAFTLETEAGGTYYLRYDELNPPPQNGQPSIAEGPLQLVSAQLGEREIAATRQVRPPQHLPPSRPKAEQPSFWSRLFD